MTILLPAFAMFLLTAFCVFRLGYLRFAAVRRGDVDFRYFRLYRGYEEPEKLAVHSRHVVNLFETPVLFYVIVIIAFATAQSGMLPLVLAWLYVVLRAGHTLVHLTSNNVLVRFRLFASSMLALVLLWATVFAGIMLR